MNIEWWVFIYFGFDFNLIVDWFNIVMYDVYIDIVFGDIGYFCSCGEVRFKY